MSPLIALPPVVWCARFEIPATPRAKPRHHTRVVTTKDGRSFARAYPDPDGVKDETTMIALAAPYAPPEPTSGPVTITLTFSLAIPESRPAWWREAALAGLVLPTSRPDLDNLEKSILDALTRSGRWWKDDSQVIGECTRKVFAAVPGTLVEVSFLEELTREKWKAIAVKSPRPVQATSDMFGGPHG